MSDDDKRDPDDVLKALGKDALRAAIDDPAKVVHLDEHFSRAGKPRILTEKVFLRTLKPINWQVRGMLQRGLCYSFTARYGTGKTTIAILLAYLIGARSMEPRRFGQHEVKPGTVAILAGENPDMVVRQMVGVRLHYGIHDDANILVVPGRFSLKTQWEELLAQFTKPVDLVVIDTASSFYEGDDENSNVQMQAYAQAIRRISTELPGNPCLLILCHPKLGATKEDMVPRGGSAFSGELDGNVALWKEGDRMYQFYATEKMRSGGFEPINVEIIAFSDPVFDDTDGYPATVPVAQVITEAESDARLDMDQSNKSKVVAWLEGAGEGGARNMDIANGLNLHKATVFNVLKDMVQAKKVRKEGSLYKLNATKTASTSTTKRKKDYLSD
jgi:hypothetical protein